MAKSRTSGAARIMSEQEFLASKGLGMVVSDYNIDKMRIPHGETARQKKQRIAEAAAAGVEYSAKRQAARDEYRRLVESGKIRKPSKYDDLIKTAKGHSDNPSVQAARRILQKRGIKW